MEVGTEEAPFTVRTFRSLKDLQSGPYKTSKEFIKKGEP